jgi:hypothetical protein
MAEHPMMADQITELEYQVRQWQAQSNANHDRGVEIAGELRAARAEAAQLREQVREMSDLLDRVHCFLVRVHAFVPSGQPECRETLHWADQTEPYSKLHRILASKSVATQDGGEDGRS